MENEHKHKLTSIFFTILVSIFLNTLFYAGMVKKISEHDMSLQDALKFVVSSKVDKNIYGDYKIKCYIRGQKNNFRYKTYSSIIKPRIDGDSITIRNHDDEELTLVNYKCEISEVKGE